MKEKYGQELNNNKQAVSSLQRENNDLDNKTTHLNNTKNTTYDTLNNTKKSIQQEQQSFNNNQTQKNQLDKKLHNTKNQKRQKELKNINKETLINNIKNTNSKIEQNSTINETTKSNIIQEEQQKTCYVDKIAILKEALKEAREELAFQQEEQKEHLDIKKEYDITKKNIVNSEHKRQSLDDLLVKLNPDDIKYTDAEREKLIEKSIVYLKKNLTINNAKDESFVIPKEIKKIYNYIPSDTEAGDISEAQEIIKHSMYNLDSVTSRKNIAVSYEHIANVSYINNNDKSATSYYIKSMQFFPRYEVCKKLADLLTVQNNPELAVKLYIAIRDPAVKKYYDKLIAESADNWQMNLEFANALTNMRYFSDAKKFFLNALQCSKVNKNIRIQIKQDELKCFENELKLIQKGQIKDDFLNSDPTCDFNLLIPTDFENLIIEDNQIPLAGNDDNNDATNCTIM